MTINAISTAAALRPDAMRLRAFPALESPFTVPMTGDRWLSHHNSIAANVPSVVPTGVATQAPATRVGYGAAKQAAPPRGVPR